MGAVYGLTVYGTDTYGTPFGSNLFAVNFAANMAITPYVADGYTHVVLSWDQLSGTWDFARLVRGSYGYPTDETDGIVLIPNTNQTGAVGTLTQSKGTYLDIVGEPLKSYYYSWFLRQTGGTTYFRAGNATIITPQNYDYSDRLYNLLPQVFRDADQQFVFGVARQDTTDALGNSITTGPLQQFLNLFGYQFDVIRSLLEALRTASDPIHIPGALLPYLLNQYGATYEAELGWRLARKQAQNAVHVYKEKGTAAGLSAAIAMLTGWAPLISPGVNLLLDASDSHFMGGLGRWKATATATITPANLTSEAVSNASGFNGLAVTATGAGVNAETRAPGFATASLPILENQTFVPQQAGASLPLWGNNGVTIDYPSQAGVPLIPLGASLPVLMGVQTYTFSAYVQAVTTSRTVVAHIYWYDINNNFISFSEGTAVTEPAAPGWIRVSVTASAPQGSPQYTNASLPLFFNSQTTPAQASASFAGYGLIFKNAVAGEVHNVSAAQFEVGSLTSSSTASLPILFSQVAGAVPHPWQPARQTQITLIAERVNLVTNPSFEIDTSGWTPTNATLASSTAQAVSGTNSAVLVTLGTPLTEFATLSPAINVSPEATYAFSAQWRTSVATNSVRLNGAAGTYISTPDIARLRVIGDIDIQAHVAMDSWTPAANTTIVAKWTLGTSNAAYQLRVLTTGALAFAGSADGITTNYQAVGPTTGFAPGSDHWIRVTRTQVDGVITFYTSTDGATWTQVGSPVSGGAGVLYAGRAPLEVGSHETGTQENLAGNVYSMHLLSAGSALISFDASTVTPATLISPGTLLSPQGDTFTPVGVWSWTTFARPIYVRVHWYGQGLPLSVVDSTAVLVNDSLTAWTTASMVIQAPGEATTAVLETGLLVGVGTLITGETHYLDGILFERAASVGNYFDGSTLPASDYLWEATPGLSRSHFYRQRGAKNNRLSQRLPDFLPAGATTGQFLYAQAPVT